MRITPSIYKQLTLEASTKRPPVFSGGKRGAATAYLTILPVAQPLPYTPRTPETTSAYALLETYCADVFDVQAGDLLVLGGREYPVKVVNEWAGVLQLVIEDLSNKRPSQ
jgi:hypothetical protein